MGRAKPIAIALALALARPFDGWANPERELPIGHSAPAPEPDESPSGADGRWEQQPTRHPPRRVSVSATIRDGERDRLLFLGPEAIWSLGMTEGLWQPMPVRGPFAGAPAGVAVFDSAHDAIYVVGGPLPRSVGELWRLDLQGGNEWVLLHDDGTRVPSSRRGASAALDPDTRTAVLFGGNDGSRWLDETWVLDLSGSPTWSRLDFPGVTPGPRTEHRLVHDRAHDRMVLIANPLAGGPTEVWALERAGPPSWTRLDVAGTPPDRIGTAVVDYDPIREWIWVDGGGDLMTVNVHTLSLAEPPTWSIQGSVLRRWSHGGAFDPLHQGLVVALGAADPVEETVYDYPGGRVEVRGPGNPYVPFRPTATGVPEPFEHAAPIAFFDRQARVIRATQGFEWLTRYYSENAHEYLYSFPRPIARACQLATTPLLQWSPFVTAGEPPSLAGMSWAYDSRRHQIVAFGGTGGCGPYNCQLSTETWELDLTGTPPKWRSVDVGGTAPPSRVEGAAVYDSVRDRVLMVGGHRSYNFWWGQLTDRLVWALDRRTHAWSALATTGTPPFEERLTSLLDPREDRLLVYSPESRGALWGLSLATGHWETLRTGWIEWGSGRALSSKDPVVYDPVDHRLLVYNLASHEVGALELAAPHAWRWLDLAGAPPATTPFRRFVHDPDGDRFWLLGGSPPTALALLELVRTNGSQAASASDHSPPGRSTAAGHEVRFGATLDRAGGCIRLELRGLGREVAGRFELFDIHGRRLMNSHIEGASDPVRRAALDATGLAPGVYLARAVTSKGMWTRRVLVLH